jgi:RNA polymerase sigma-70 factor, ECF subfamily
VSLYTGNTGDVLNIQTSEEKELVLRVQKGDRNAQYIMYKQYIDAMYHTVLRILNNSTDAQDVAQECFVKVFEKINSFRGESTIGAWIKKIAINTAINSLRQKKRNLEYSFDDIPELQLLVEEDTTVNILNNKMIHDAVLNLPSGCRAVLNLYIFEGYSHKEVADILEITESTSKTQYRRAKILLRDTLKSKYEENEY